MSELRSIVVTVCYVVGVVLLIGDFWAYKRRGKLKFIYSGRQSRIQSKILPQVLKN